MREIVNGTAWALIARVIALILGLLCNIFLARTYGAGTIGIIAVVNSFLMLSSIPSLLGFNTSILRLIPEYRVKFSLAVSWAIYRRALLLVVLASLFVSALLYVSKSIVAERLFFKPHLELFIGLASLFVIFKTLTLFNIQVIRALGKIRTFAFMMVLPQLINLFLYVFAWYFWAIEEGPILAVLFGLVVTGLTGCLLVERSYRAGTDAPQITSSTRNRVLLDASLPMMMTGVFSIICGELGIIILGIYGTEADVGIFSIAVKLATLTGFALKAISTIVAPKISELKYSDDESELFYIVKNTSKVIFWTSSPILLFLLIFGELILVVLFGIQFAEGYHALCFIVLGQFVNSISGATGIFLNMTGDQRVYRNIILVGAIIFVALNSILIPLYGILGAGIAVFLTECIWNSTSLIYIRRKYGRTTGYFPLLG